MDVEALTVLIPVVAIIGGISVAIASIVGKTRLRELQIRERIAMIEKGLVPPPEVDPAGFDRALARHKYVDYEYRRAGRSRRAGIILLGVGFGLIVLRYLDASGSTRGTIGAGGFIVILGLAFLINSFFDQFHGSTAPSSPPSTSVSRPPKVD